MYSKVTSDNWTIEQCFLSLSLSLSLSLGENISSQIFFKMVNHVGRQYIFKKHWHVFSPTTIYARLKFHLSDNTCCWMTICDTITSITVTTHPSFFAFIRIKNKIQNMQNKKIEKMLDYIHNGFVCNLNKISKFFFTTPSPSDKFLDPRLLFTQLS